MKEIPCRSIFVQEALFLVTTFVNHAVWPTRKLRRLAHSSDDLLRCTLARGDGSMHCASVAFAVSRFTCEVECLCDRLSELFHRVGATHEGVRVTAARKRISPPIIGIGVLKLLLDLDGRLLKNMGQRVDRLANKNTGI